MITGVGKKELFLFPSLTVGRTLHLKTTLLITLIPEEPVIELQPKEPPPTCIRSWAKQELLHWRDTESFCFKKYSFSPTHYSQLRSHLMFKDHTQGASSSRGQLNIKTTELNKETQLKQYHMENEDKRWGHKGRLSQWEIQAESRQYVGIHPRAHFTEIVLFTPIKEQWQQVS